MGSTGSTDRWPLWSLHEPQAARQLSQLSPGQLAHAPTGDRVHGTVARIHGQTSASRIATRTRGGPFEREPRANRMYAKIGNWPCMDVRKCVHTTNALLVNQCTYGRTSTQAHMASNIVRRAEPSFTSWPRQYATIPHSSDARRDDSCSRTLQPSIARFLYISPALKRALYTQQSTATAAAHTTVIRQRRGP